MSARSADPEFATIHQISRAAGVTAQTVSNWIAQGLLPAPAKVPPGPFGGVFPASAIERARFIAERRVRGHSIAEVRTMLAELDAQ